MPDRRPDHYDPTAVEQDAKDHWTDPDAFEGVAGQGAEPDQPAAAATSPAYEYVKRTGEDGDPFYFLDGPPFTSGQMHVGNAWGKILKDCLLRYLRMQGFDVRARPGYDVHGLPVEVRVEGRHDFAAKADVEDYGVDRFTAECRAFAAEQCAEMTAEFQDLGVWMDWNDPYVTMDADYVDAVWNAFERLHETGLVERERSERVDLKPYQSRAAK